MATDLNQLLQVLLKSKIEFVVIGGFAGLIHGTSRVTRDLDICLSMSEDDLEKLRELLRPYNPKHRRNPKEKLSFLDVPQNFQGWKNLYLETDLGILDIIGEVSGVGSFDRIKKKSVSVELYEHSCRVMSIEDLIQSKRALGRDHDLLDIQELEQIRHRTHNRG
ncbi:MAG: nucleotidyltransferase [Bradymonadales bacterium]|nr:MAG: nucleotidyltransferase [Bradymonadales bacterium]